MVTRLAIKVRRLWSLLSLVFLLVSCADTVRREAVPPEDLPFFDYMSQRFPEGLTKDDWRYAQWYYHRTKGLSPEERARFSDQEIRRLDSEEERYLRALEFYSPSFNQPATNFPTVPPRYTITPYSYGTTIRGSDGSVMTCTRVGKEQVCQ